MVKPSRIIIVGGNAAGPAAAAKAKRVNPSAEVLLFEAGEFISTGTCEIPYVLSGDIKDYEEIILYHPVKFKEDKGVDAFVNHLVEEIHPKEKQILVRNLQNNKQIKYEYDNLVLTTGAVPKRVTSLPNTLTNVFNLTKIKDLIEISSYLKKNKVKNIGIIGSGYIGLEAADALYTLGYDVSIIEKGKLPLPAAEPEMQYLILEEIKNKNISFYSDYVKLKVIYDEDKVSGLNVDGRILDFDLIITSIGFSPNTALAIQAKLKTGDKGGIKVDRKLKTSDPNIFAAGDNIEVINGVTNQSDYMPFANIAYEYGHAAGENAAGGNITVEPVIRNSAVKIFDKFFVSAGINSNEAKSNNILTEFVYDNAFNLVKMMPGSQKSYGKIIYEKSTKRILGATFFGGRETSGYGDLISTLIKLKQSVNILADINFNYTPPLSPFINLLSKLGKKAK